MRFSRLLLGGLLAATAAPAFAQDTAPPKPFTVTGGATVVSDYRFRGISQTNLKAALQGTFTVTHESGFYVSVWGSSIDDYIANGSDQELDLIAGYSHSFAGGVKVDGGILYYYYPGGGHAKTDFAEPYLDVSGTYGPASLKVTAAYAPKQQALSIGAGREDNFYLAGDLSAGIPRTPFALTGHLGHTFGQGYLSIDRGYTDWSLGATATFGHLSGGVSYVDTNKNVYLNNRNLTGSGVVASVGVSF